MKPRFLADADLKRAILTGVKRREPAVDFETAEAAALEGLEDPLVLALAAEGARILFTWNSKDFAPLLREWAEAGRHHAGRSPVLPRWPAARADRPA